MAGRFTANREQGRRDAHGTMVRDGWLRMSELEGILASLAAMAIA